MISVRNSFCSKFKRSTKRLSRIDLFAGLAVLLAAEFIPAQQLWPQPVPGHIPVIAGEHPRLLFRKSDLPSLKQRAQTTEGKAIISQLNKNLAGSYTIWHGCGYGMLYQLTGDNNYAIKGRDAVQKALNGTRDRDTRYAFVKPSGALRAGPSIAAVAMAYDLCYDGWDAAFRKKVIDRILYYNETNSSNTGDRITMEGLALKPRHHPASNHWGAQVGGIAIALQAIRGDPGSNNELVNKYLQTVEKNIIRGLSEGFGDGGYFAEHAGPSHMMSYSAFLTGLRAMKIAGGKDFISPRPNAQWITLRWAHELILSNGRPYSQLRHSSSYGTQDLLDKQGQSISYGGWFSQGFGAIEEKDKPALLWVYNTFVKAADRSTCDAAIYPHLAVQALVNWPIGVQATNPEKTIPKARIDNWHGYCVFRNKWSNADDIVVSALLGTRWNTPYDYWGAEPVMVWGLKQKLTFGSFEKQAATHFAVAQDGSGVVSAVSLSQCDLKFVGGTLAYAPKSGAAVTSLAVDYSGASGAAALIVMTGPGSGGGTAVAAGGRTFRILTLPSTTSSQARTSGDKVVLGNQTVSFDGQKIVLGVFRPSTEVFAETQHVGGYVSSPGIFAGEGSRLLRTLSLNGRAVSPGISNYGAGLYVKNNTSRGTEPSLLNLVPGSRTKLLVPSAK